MRTHRICGSAAAVAVAAELLFHDLLVERLRDSGRFFILLSGGTTPKAMYRLIVENRMDEAEQYGRADYFMGDERSVPLDSPQSNAGEAFREFLDPLSIAQGRRHFLNGASPDLQREAQRTTDLMKLIVPADASGVPVFDLVFLGMGTDGHTASLFPGTPALADESPRYAVNTVPQLETTRITATYPILNAAREVAILVTGENKARIVAEIFGAAPRTATYPIERVDAARTTWLLDDAAASLLAK